MFVRGPWYTKRPLGHRTLHSSLIKIIMSKNMKIKQSKLKLLNEKYLEMRLSAFTTFNIFLGKNAQSNQKFIYNSI